MISLWKTNENKFISCLIGSSQKYCNPDLKVKQKSVYQATFCVKIEIKTFLTSSTDGCFDRRFLTGVGKIYYYSRVSYKAKFFYNSRVSSLNFLNFQRCC